MYDLISSFHPRASSSGTTFPMTATPRLRSESEKGRTREWFLISEKGIVGIIEEPALEMCSTSDRREERRRDQEEMSSVSWSWMREALSSANRARGTGSEPDRLAKTEDMSPSFLGV
jgi:hypothetical protein